MTALSGSDYALGDEFSVPGGNNDSEIEVSKISQTGFRGGPSCQITTDWIYTKTDHGNYRIYRLLQY